MCSDYHSKDSALYKGREGCCGPCIVRQALTLVLTPGWRVRGDVHVVLLVPVSSTGQTLLHRGPTSVLRIRLDVRGVLVPLTSS